MNANILGKNINDFKDRDKILLVADAVKPNSYIHSMADINRKRHIDGKGYFAAFLDFHTRIILADEKVRLQ